MSRRTEWIDHVKGITITMVVAHHVLSGLDARFDMREFNYWYEILSPVRMPLFFLVAGLFARKAIEGPARNLVDGKVLHFFYFYLLWSCIAFALRFGLNPITNHQTQADEILNILWNPLPTLWFLYALALVFLIARAMRSVAPGYAIAFAALIQAVSISNPNFWGQLVILDRVGSLLVYFLIGVYSADWIKARAEDLDGRHALAGFIGFAALALVARYFNAIHQPLMYFSLSAVSAFAIISLSVFTVRTGAAGLFTFIGAHSLYIYLTHFLPAAGVRIVLMKLGIDSPAIIFPVALVIAVAFGIVFYRVAKDSPLRFLVFRPELFRLRHRVPAATPAE
jgi:uncharacterized membrane protein YcfT